MSDFAERYVQQIKDALNSPEMIAFDNWLLSLPEEELRRRIFWNAVLPSPFGG